MTAQKIPVKVRYWAESCDAGNDWCRESHQEQQDWKFVIYEAYGEDQQPVYVGRTKHIAQRMKEHAYRAPWWSQVSSLVVSLVPCKYQMYRGERLLIASLRPKYNRIRTYERGVAGGSRRALPERPSS